MNINPCKGCSDRTIEPNCHMECPKYKSWFDEKERIKEVRANEKKLDAYFNMRKKVRRK